MSLSRFTLLYSYIVGVCCVSCINAVRLLDILMFIVYLMQSFPYDLVTRVWDVFLQEDWKVMYRVCLALFKHVEEQVTDTLIHLYSNNMFSTTIPTILLLSIHVWYVYY